MNLFPHIYSFFGFIGYLKNLSYPEIYLIIISSGHLIPVPEPVTLLILGYLAGVGRSSLIGLLIVTFLAVITFDLIIYFIGKSGSRLADKLTKKIHTHILDRYKDASNLELSSLFILSHFIPGWRIANPIIAGITDIDLKKFFTFTLISSFFYTPVYLLLGYFLRSKIFSILKVFQKMHGLLGPIIILILLVGAVVYLALEKRKKVYNTGHAKE